MCPTAAAAAVIYRGEMQGVHCINIPTFCSGYTRQVCVCEKRNEALFGEGCSEKIHLAMFFGKNL